MKTDAAGQSFDDGLFWELEDVHYPNPPSRWAARLLLEGQSRGIAELMAESGLLLEGIRFVEHEGGVYVGMIPLGGKARKAPPTWLMPLLWRIHPELRRRIKTALRRESEGAPRRLVDDWLDHQERDLIDDAMRHLKVDLTALSDEQLDSELGFGLEYADRALKKHFELHGAGIFEIGMFAMELTQQHGFTTAEVAGLLTGLSDTTTGPAEAQQEIVDAVVRVNASSVLANAESLGSVRAISTEVDGLIDAYMDVWARRAIRYEVAYPTIAEQPGWVLARFKEQLARPLDPSVKDRGAAIRDSTEARVLAACGDTEETREQIARARRAFPIREGNEAATVGYPLAVARHIGQEYGRRLSDRGLLNSHDHVFDLTVDEARVALLDESGSPGDYASKAADRYETRMGGRADLPRSFGTQSPLPDFSGFPAHVGESVMATLWYTSKLGTMAPPGADADPTEIEAVDDGYGGLGVSPGSYEGPARIVLDEADFSKIEPGDVMVCPITSPVWSMVFPALGALVCDTGGPLSHPAIIAREFAIPAVVGTGSATSGLTDGETVIVDGDAGTVRRS